MAGDNIFGEWLKRSRLQRGLDLGDLASLSGVDRSSIYRLESGAGQPTVCTTVRLCNALQISPDELILMLEGRQTTPHPVVAQERNDVVTPKDIETFVITARNEPQLARGMLARWLSGISNKAPQLSENVIDVFLSNVPFIKSEMIFPPALDGQYILDLYEQGAAIMLRDVGACVRWMRRQQYKSLVKMGEPLDISDSSLSRLETGALEKIRFLNILAIDRDLNADGKILWMCWAACNLLPPMNKYEQRLALTLLAIVRWWQHLHLGDSSLISQIHNELNHHAAGR